MKIILLDTDSYNEKYEESAAPVDDIPFEELEADAEALDSRIKTALESIGLTDDDFEVSDEWQECFHHCAGIYTEKAHRRETLEKIGDAISKSRYPKRWYFHVACEAAEEFEGAEDMGEFFIHDGIAYFDSESSSLHSLFTDGKES